MKTIKTYPPQQQAHRILICLLAALTFAAFKPAARADTTNWIADGDWFNAANWDNGVPGTSTDAFINNGGKSEINGFQATARALTLGAAESDAGTLSVDGTTGGFLSVGPCFNCNGAAVEGSVYVGRSGGGTLSITNGGTVVSAGYAYVALQQGTVMNSNGSVSVDGAGSTWTVNGGRLYVGGDNATLAGGTAILSVTNGGAVTINNPINAGAGLPVGVSGTLAGNGTVTLNATDPNGGASARRVVVNGTVAPTGGTLSINGNLALNSLSTTLVNVTPQVGDRVDVLGTGTAGAAILGGRLIVVLSGEFTPDPSCVKRFTLLHADAGRTLTFSSVSIQSPKFALFTSQITYDGNNVYLDLVFDHCTPPN